MLDDIRNKVGTVILPADAKTPVVTEIETDTGRAFSVFVYDPSGKSSRSVLVARAIDLQQTVKFIPGIESVDLSASADTGPIGGGGANETTYDAEIIIPEDKLTSL